MGAPAGAAPAAEEENRPTRGHGLPFSRTPVCRNGRPADGVRVDGLAVRQMGDQDLFELLDLLGIERPALSPA